MYFITFKCWIENVMLWNRRQYKVLSLRRSLVILTWWWNVHCVNIMETSVYQNFFYSWRLNIIIVVVVVSNESLCFIFIDPILNIHIELRSIIVWQKDFYEIVHYIHRLFSKKFDIGTVFVLLLSKSFVMLCVNIKLIV